MSRSIKLQDNNYLNSSSISHNHKILSDILENYESGTPKITTVIDSYVRLFTFEMSAIWKNTSILFYLNDTQSRNFSQLVDFSVKKNTSEEQLDLHTFKTFNFAGDVSPKLVAIITSINKIEVYFKMGSSESPTINIIAMSKHENNNDFGKLTIDCSTVISTLPSGTQKFVTNLL